MLDIVTIKDVKIQLGRACKHLRKANDLSREELAETLDISRATIQNIENGKNATLDTILKIANHFGLLSSISNQIDKMTTNQDNISLYE